MTSNSINQQLTVLEEGQKQLRIQMERILNVIQKISPAPAAKQPQRQERIKTMLSKEWLDGQEVMLLLNISKSKLLRMRKLNEIAYTQVGPRKFLYSRLAIEALMHSASQQKNHPALKDNPYLKE